MVKASEGVRELKEILSKAGIDDAGFEVGLLVKHVTGKSRFDTEEFSLQEWNLLQSLVARRATRYPLQYLVQTWPFMELELAVGPGVLIPRPETETVCLAAIKEIRALFAPAVLDLCAGTGALALGIARHVPGAVVTAVEFSKEAFFYLQKNIAAYVKTAKNPPVAVLADAIGYQRQLLPESLDLVVSNPPYVTEEEYAALAPELYHEPRLALVAGEEGLYFYRQLAGLYKDSLKPGGRIVFETGDRQAAAVEKILMQAGYIAIGRLPDMAGKDRVVKAQKKTA
ncbi:MAG: peptide chain release factor N(5)-glutamine methyltransferase [Oscillospiraceae bacterium]